jgi:16S rRNA processing protein RimM
VAPDRSDLVTLGEVVGVFGVRGWVKVHSWTRPREQIFSFRQWQVGHDRHWQPRRLLEGRAQGRGLVAQLEGCDDRDSAHALVGQQIAVAASELPPLPEGEYYWHQLVGLEVIAADGRRLGRIESMMETGANDVMVVQGERERLIPYVPDVVRAIDLDAGTMQVDWDPEF